MLRPIRLNPVPFLLFFFILSFKPGFSQGPQVDSVSIKDQIAQATALYDNFTGPQASIYNGGDYLPYVVQRDGSPFFRSDTLTTGWVSYEGKIYQPMLMQYDVTRDQVLILNSDKRSKIILHNELVDSFHFSQHTFIKKIANSHQNLANTGFYDLLYDGDVKVLVNRKKLIKDVIRDNSVVWVFADWHRYYVYKSDKYYLVSNKKDVFRLFGNKRHEIKTGMRRQKIKFRKANFEEALLVAAKIYDQH